MYKRLSSFLPILICSVCTLLLFAGARPIPRLILLLSVDQMGEEYFERFAGEFTGGLGRIYHEGVFFSHADLNYAASETGPGHATLASGSYPAHNGITGNVWIEPNTGRWVYCVEDSSAFPLLGEGGYRSPKNLLVSTVGDWLKASSPSSKVISISSKDRAAILMGGKEADYAFWYDALTGHMVTSSYYADSLPGWAIKFNKSNWIGQHLPAEWERLFPEERYALDEADDAPGELPWNGSATFPHPFTDPTRQILTSPFGDFLTLDFAYEAMMQERLGQREAPDMLCISLSCTDYVGHSFGPHSQEMHDHLLRIDRRLGEFIAALEEMVGREEIFIALGADHGVLPLPQYLAEHGNKRARRLSFESQVKVPVLALDSTLRMELQTSQTVISLNGLLNYEAAVRKGIDSITFEKKIRSALLKIQGIEDVYFRRELAGGNIGERPYIDLFRRSFYSPRGEDFQIRFCQWCLLTEREYGTSHGSPYAYDTRVPVAFLWGDRRPTIVTRNIATVDIAPTIGSVLNLVIPPDLDGRVLPEIEP